MLGRALALRWGKFVAGRVRVVKFGATEFIMNNNVAYRLREACSYQR